jgi:hypothetical protein
MVVKNASLNPDGWVVHLEADGRTGRCRHLRHRRKIENLAMHNRGITGTLKEPRGTAVDQPADWHRHGQQQALWSFQS